MVEAHLLPELSRSSDNLISAYLYVYTESDNYSVEGGCGMGFWPLEAYRYCSSKGRSAFTILQSSIEKYQKSFQDSRVAHPTHLGFLPL